MNFINLPLLTALTFGERIKMGLQVLVFGMPSTIIMQSVHLPMAQKMPRFS